MDYIDMRKVTSCLYCFIIVFCFCGISVNANAQVNAKNGNLNVGYNDLVLEDAEDNEVFALNRTYNSIATKTGWFGLGWGSDLETILVKKDDGYVVVFNGSAQSVKFIGDAKDGNIVTYVNRTRYVLQAMDGGAILTNSENGDIYEFDEDGMLSLIIKSGTKTKLEWDDALLLADVGGIKVKLHFEEHDGERRLVRAELANGDARYTYKNGNLIQSKDTESNKFRYEYDEFDRLVRIRYEDGTTRKFEYQDGRRWITKQEYRDNSFYVYDYHQDTENPNKDYSTIVTRYDRNGAVHGIDTYWFIIDESDNGDDWLREIRRSVNDVSNAKSSVMNAIYNECCGMPVVVHFDNININIEYKEKGRGWLISTIKEIGSKNRMDFEYNKNYNPTRLIYNKDEVIGIINDDNGDVLVESDGEPEAIREIMKKFQSWYDALLMVSTCECMMVSR